MEEKEPILQNQEFHHKIPTSLNQEKSVEFAAASHIEEKQQPKRSNESEMDEQGCKNNGGKDEEENTERKSDHNNNIKVEGPRERLKRHRTEVAGQVWIPDTWGQEDFLKDWIDCSAFDASLVSQNIMLARAALMEEGRRSSSNSLRVENSC